MIKRICILAKSLKDREYCVAGIDVTNGKWVRLVSSKNGDAMPKEMFDNEQNPIDVLDVIAVKLKGHVPCKCQSENWLIDENTPLVKQTKFTLTDILKIRPLDKPQYIFVNDKPQLTIAEAKSLNTSLLIVEVSDIVLDTSKKGDGRHHYKISFKYNGSDYKISLTDPELRKEELDGFPLHKGILIISIPCEPYGENDLFYKFAAKVFLKGM